MTFASETDRARARLAADRAATASRLAALESGFAGMVAASEGSTIAYERSQLAALVAQAQAHLGEIDGASERIAAGDYGRCTVCGGNIPGGRLEARPTASTCVGCAAGGHGRGGRR